MAILPHMGRALLHPPMAILGLGLFAAACSVINSPEEATPPDDGQGGAGAASTTSSGGASSSSSSSSSSGGGGGGIVGTCGNGMMETGEVCDDGFNTECGDCNTDCSGPGTGSTCGDGAVCEDTEVCDDGFATACGDCNETCTLTGTGSTCGDGVVCPDTENCDDGFTTACGACNMDCSAPGTGSTCGDNDVCPDTEACDDGNTLPCGGSNMCTANCAAMCMTTTIAATHRGWWTDSGDHTATNNNTLTGQSGSTNYRSYFTFNLSGLANMTVESATLRLELEDFSSTNSSENFSAYDVTTNVVTLEASGSGQVGIYNDLGGGTFYGSYFGATSAQIGNVLTINLNANAVSDIQAKVGGNNFAIGIRCTTCSSTSTQFVKFSQSNEARTHELQVVAY